MIDTSTAVMIATAVGANVVTMAAGIAVLKNDVKWFKQWCAEHENSDVTRFASLNNDLANERDARHSLRDDVGTQTLRSENRLATLEANQHVEQIILAAISKRT